MKNVIIKRERYLEKIRPFYDSDYIKVITGIRRCGKSELLKQIMQEIQDSGIDKNHIIYIDFEGKSGEGLITRKRLEQYLDKKITDNKTYYIFIDEIQHMKKFEEAIASIRVSYNCSLFITGSNSKLLSGKMRDRLTGRAKEFVVRPFTFAETLDFKKANKLPTDEDDFFDYLRWGGMPQRFQEKDEDGIESYLTDIFNSIIDKDVFQNHKRLRKAAFLPIAHYVMRNSGKLFSASSIARYMKGGTEDISIKSESTTINRYASYLEESFFVDECLPFFLQGKEALKGTRKFYVVDPGFMTALNRNVDYDDTFALEGIIYNELLTRGYKVRYGKMRDSEVDFVVSQGKKKCFIQVAYRIESEKTFNREYGALKKVKDASPKYVLSLDKKDTSNNGIVHINIIDFLLGKNDIVLL